MTGRHDSAKDAQASPRALHRRAVLGASLAAATAGALTVGFVGGVAATATTTSPTSSSTSSGGTSSTSTSGTGSSSASSSKANVAPAPRDARADAGSNGS